MFDSPVLNVIIGIVFIYLLYSLLASLVSEIIATNLGLRARMLELAIQRMLNDDKEQHFWVEFKTKVIDYLRRVANQVQYVLPFWKKFKLEPEKTLAGRFYQQPLIKYLGDSKFFKKPPYIGKENFSKNLFDMLKGMGEEVLQNKNASPLEKIQAALGVNQPDGKAHKDIEKETLQYLRTLLEDANNDLDKFRAQTEKWFDDTMQRATGWYKKHIQIILFTIGMVLAITFNVDTVQIITRLSKDDKARDQMVQMAMEYTKNNSEVRTKPTGDSVADLDSYNKRMDSLTKAVDSLLAKDIKNANGLVAIGWDTPPRFDSYDKATFANDDLKYDCQSCLAWVRGKQVATDKVDRSQRIRYLACIILKDPMKIFGFFITALAISLGAPFWFDLLKKLMQLRGDGAKPENNNAAPSGNSVPVTKRVG